VTAVAAPGKLPLHLESSRTPSAEDGIGLVLDDPRTGGRLAYFSGVAGPSPDIERAIAGAGAVFFDGTFWSSDELIAAGLGTRRAEEMAHWPIGGAEGSMRFLERSGARRRILIHVNNTNPILREDGAERRALAAAGVEVAEDGMELTL
jgi:pyrroloquinoline quinone biosynthesis protein B